tara:strand:- start:404 stop:655 length:252 start_codon:yes stop_codon:yes gene_type:complete
MTKLKTHEQDDIISQFYLALADDDIRSLAKMHIPRSEVFYTREKYYQDTNNWETLDKIERSMYLEGMLSASDVLDPQRKRSWE